MADIFDEIAPEPSESSDIFDELVPEQRAGPTIERAQAEGLMPTYGPPTRSPQTPGERFKDTSFGQDVISGVDSGIRGAGIGLAQLGLEAADWALPGSPLESQVEFARGKETERRKYIDPLKEKYGGAGVTNPVSVAEFAGEVAPYAVAGGVSAARGATSKLPVSYARTALEGLGIGGMFGAAAPLEEGESRLMSTGLGAGGGAVLGPAARFGLEGAGVVGKAVGRKTKAAIDRLALAKESPETAKLLAQPGNKIIEEGLRKMAPRTPSQVQTPQALAREIQNDNTAIRTIAKLRDEIKLTRDGTEVSGKLPETLNEALEATTQSAGKIAGWIDDLATSASNQGVRVPVKSVIAELRKVSGGVQQGYLPSQRQLADKWIKELEPLAQRGGLPVKSALRLMTNLNNDIKAIFTGKNVSGDSPEVLGLVANDLRQSLNATLEKSTGTPAFAELRRNLGQLMNLERRLLKKVEREANKESKNQLSIFDIIAAEQMIRGVARGKAVTGIGEGTASYLTGKAAKLLRSPDRSVRRVFKAADYITGKERMAAPSINAANDGTYFDPTTGTRVPRQPSADPRIPTGQSSGAPYQQGTYYDPAVGSRVQRKP